MLNWNRPTTDVIVTWDSSYFNWLLGIFLKFQGFSLTVGIFSPSPQEANMDLDSEKEQSLLFAALLLINKNYSPFFSKC